MSHSRKRAVVTPAALASLRAVTGRLADRVAAIEEVNRERAQLELDAFVSAKMRAGASYKAAMRMAHRERPTAVRLVFSAH